MAIFDRVITVEEWEKVISNDIDEILDILTAFDLIRDIHDPVYQVEEVVEKGESLDNYHWEKEKIKKGTDVYIGVRLVKNSNA